MSTPFPETARHYSALIAPLLDPGTFTPEREDAFAIQVERGSILSLILSDQPPDDRVARLLTLPRAGQLSDIAVIDGSGHQRPVYLPLLVYALLQSFRRLYESVPRAEFGQWEESSRAWADLLESNLGGFVWDTDSALAENGSTLAAAAWTALALHVAGKAFVRDAFTDLASDVFGHLAHALQPNGAFLLRTATDNPETHWYHELLLIHAAASYAVQAEDRALAIAVQRNSQFHLAETQPDHATNLPLGLFAFIWNPDTRTLADQQLHTAQTHPSPLGTILLADAQLALNLFLKR